MLDLIKTALRIKTGAFDDELNNLIMSSILDLKLSGALTFLSEEKIQTDNLVITAVITYCKYHFGDGYSADKFKKSYDEQKAQMISAAGYGLENG